MQLFRDYPANFDMDSVNVEHVVQGAALPTWGLVLTVIITFITLTILATCLSK